MCCGGRMCMLCVCLIAIVVAIGFLFGFGVFKNGFHKLKDTFHLADNCINAAASHCSSSRPFLGFPLANSTAPSPSN
ncbi:uncharacterized protein LOC125840790 [Solanum verrucosum]|uniref:uncharacterized protein LOC125840790 n=1 Tax=Solanum verrucosum TaxID=315347 RepID=UPI0020D1C76B|nr:uncharacterized protein LOC125840790 [Solanum verrucosum]